MSAASSSSMAPRRRTSTMTNTTPAGTAPSSSSSSPSSKGSSMSPRLFSTASTSAASAASAQDITAHAIPHAPAPASASRSASRSASASASVSASASASANSQSPPHSHLQSSLPSAETERHIAQARSAIVATMANLLDTELQSRAQMLHDNASALDKQEKDVVRATEGLRRETGKLAKEADAAARKLKEVGNVQNWAEVLERGFLVLEETVRLANGGAESDDGSSTCSCDCSQCGRLSDGDDEAMQEDDDENNDGNEGASQNRFNGERQGMSLDADMDIDAVSNVSRSTTGWARESETASVAASVSTT